MLRIIRANRNSIFKLIPARRKYSKSSLSVAFKTGDEDEEVRYRTQKNPVIPSIQGLEKRWLTMDAGQQDDIVAYIEDKMRSDWKQMSEDEKRAAWFIWYGNWGPRSSQSNDMANAYLYMASGIALMMGGLAVYKLSTWDPKEEVEGISYD